MDPELEMQLKEFEDWKKAKANITKIEVKPEPVEPLPKKEKKPRTEKQIEATRRMREALSTNRKEHNTKKTEHTELYQKSMEVAREKADTIKELVPMAKVVVKSRVGRPKGSKNPPTDPTPCQSDNEEEELPKKSIQPKKPIVIPTKPVLTKSPLQLYLESLNRY